MKNSWEIGLPFLLLKHAEFCSLSSGVKHFHGLKAMETSVAFTTPPSNSYPTTLFCMSKSRMDLIFPQEFLSFKRKGRTTKIKPDRENPLISNA